MKAWVKFRHFLVSRKISKIKRKNVKMEDIKDYSCLNKLIKNI